MLWSRRDESEEKTNEVKRYFKWDVVIKDLENDLPDISLVIKKMYEWHIDQGSHPNPDAILGSSAIDKVSEGSYSIQDCIYILMDFA